jgi:hypothetical protein
MSVEAALREARDALCRARAEIVATTADASDTAAAMLGRLRNIEWQIDECVRVYEDDSPGPRPT